MPTLLPATWLGDRKLPGWGSEYGRPPCDCTLLFGALQRLRFGSVFYKLKARPFSGIAICKDFNDWGLETAGGTVGRRAWARGNIGAASGVSRSPEGPSWSTEATLHMRCTLGRIAGLSEVRGVCADDVSPNRIDGSRVPRARARARTARGHGLDGEARRSPGQSRCREVSVTRCLQGCELVRSREFDPQACKKLQNCARGSWL